MSVHVGYCLTSQVAILHRDAVIMTHALTNYLDCLEKVNSVLYRQLV